MPEPSFLSYFPVKIDGRWKGYMNCGSYNISMTGNFQSTDSAVSGTVGVSDGTNAGNLLVTGVWFG